MRPKINKRIAVVSISIAITALALFVIMRVFGNSVYTNQMLASAEVRYFAERFEEYRRDKGRYPTTLEGFDELERAGYVRPGILDPWSNKFHYRYPSQQADVVFEFWSTGGAPQADGRVPPDEIGNWRRKSRVSWFFFPLNLLVPRDS